MTLWLIALVAIGVVAFLAITIIWGIRAHRYQVSAGREDLVGKSAIVKTALEPQGVVFVEGEHWIAVSEKDRVEAEEEVIVTKIDRLKLWVVKKE